MKYYLVKNSTTYEQKIPFENLHDWFYANFIRMILRDFKSTCTLENIYEDVLNKNCNKMFINQFVYMPADVFKHFNPEEYEKDFQSHIYEWLEELYNNLKSESSQVKFGDFTFKLIEED